MDERNFEELIAEFRRVGVDPDTLSAGLAVKGDDALRVLRSLPDDAGPAAFLSAVRARITPDGGVPQPQPSGG